MSELRSTVVGGVKAVQCEETRKYRGAGSQAVTAGEGGGGPRQCSREDPKMAERLEGLGRGSPRTMTTVYDLIRPFQCCIRTP